ncbi:MAG: transcriptional repressor [Chromatiales bacterium]|nr:transcriptional repressor [Chromatiales bacterium]
MNGKAITREEVARRLVQSGINLTPPADRDCVRIVFADGAPLGRSDPERRQRRAIGDFKATVYNTLSLFREKSLVREVIVDPSRVFYDPNTDPHHHFYDTVTGQLTDIEADAIHLVGVPPLPAGVVAETVDIVIRTRPAT